MAKQLGAEAYLECSAFTSEKSIHSVFRTAAMACMNKLQPANKPSPVRRLSKRLLHLPSKTELLSSTFSKDKSKSCTIMWITEESKDKQSADASAGVRGVQGKESILPKTLSLTVWHWTFPQEHTIQRMKKKCLMSIFKYTCTKRT